MSPQGAGSHLQALTTHFVYRRTTRQYFASSSPNLSPIPEAHASGNHHAWQVPVQTERSQSVSDAGTVHIPVQHEPARSEWRGPQPPRSNVSTPELVSDERIYATLAPRNSREPQTQRSNVSTPRQVSDEPIYATIAPRNLRDLQAPRSNMSTPEPVSEEPIYATIEPRSSRSSPVALRESLREIPVKPDVPPRVPLRSDLSRAQQASPNAAGPVRRQWVIDDEGATTVSERDVMIMNGKVREIGQKGVHLLHLLNRGLRDPQGVVTTTTFPNQLNTMHEAVKSFPRDKNVVLGGFTVRKQQSSVKNLGKDASGRYYLSEKITRFLVRDKDLKTRDSTVGWQLVVNREIRHTEKPIGFFGRLPKW